jgi:hypothetical protein
MHVVYALTTVAIKKQKKKKDYASTHHPTLPPFLLWYCCHEERKTCVTMQCCMRSLKHKKTRRGQTMTAKCYALKNSGPLQRPKRKASVW